MKKYICTLSDINYFFRGMALIDSLKKHNDNIIVYYLCMDRESYEKSKKINDETVKFIFIDDIIKNDNRFKNITASREAIASSEHSNINSNLMELLYIMSSYFPKYCLETFDIDHVIYADSDIYFYESLDSVYADVESKDLGLVEHRIPHTNCGFFNVGIIYFKNSKTAKSILNFWNYCVMDQSNPFHKEYGDCGDQKYLELIYKIYKNDISIIGDKTGHLAPWNLLYHRYSDDGEIWWMNKKQKLVYIHFSNFDPDFDSMTYKVAPRHGINSIESVPWLAKKCEQYLNSLKDNL